MAYNYFPNTYQPAQFYPTQPNAVPNSTVTLWDTESQTIYIKSADSSGMPTMKVLDYTLRGGAPEIQKIPPQSGFATKDDFDALREEFVHLKERVEALGKE